MTDHRNKKRRYAAFLSYSHQDSEWASWLHRTIERYHPPRKLKLQDANVRDRLKPVFRDRDELPSAGDLGEKITRALGNSRALIVVCSPACARSRWTNQEILQFKQTHGENSIFCLIVDGEPGSGDHLECFPPALKYRLADDGTLSDERVEPIAADVRPGKDGKQLARLKLIAGLLDVGLDDLRQREQQRRNRKLFAITIASLAGMALTGVLAFTAMVARDDAERRQRQAESLVEFMLGDLKNKLGEVGRLDALDATARKTEEYFSELPKEELDDDALAGQAKAYRAIGEIHFDRLEWDQALRTYAKSLEATQALQRRNPDSSEFLYDLAQSEFWLGYVYLESGDPAKTEPLFKRYLEHSLALLDYDDTNPDWIMEVSYGHSNLAAMYDQTGRDQVAILHATEGVDWNRKAAALAPDDPYYRYELAGALDWLARSQMRNGQLRASAETYRELNSINTSILAADTENRQAQQRLAGSLRGEAWINNLLGQHDIAFQLLGKALEHYTAIAEHDPSNELWSYWAQDTALDWLLFEQDSTRDMPQPHQAQILVRAFSQRSYPDDPLREARRLLASGLLVLHSFADASPDTQLQQALDVQQSFNALVRREGADHRVIQAAARFQLALSAQDAFESNSEIVTRLLDELSRAAQDSQNPFMLSLYAQLALEFDATRKISSTLERLVHMGYATMRFALACQNSSLDVQCPAE